MPNYLPREFLGAIIVAVYIPPSALLEETGDIIHTITARLRTQHPNAFLGISVDLLSSTLPTMYQFFDQREQNTGFTVCKY